jgi:hypothetical protein
VLRGTRSGRRQQLDLAPDLDRFNGGQELERDNVAALYLGRAPNRAEGPAAEVFLKAVGANKVAGRLSCGRYQLGASPLERRFEGERDSSGSSL